MSANKSNMPGGTRLAALFALAITACLFAWRANSFLTDHASHRSDLSAEQSQLVSLIEPVLGKTAFRFARHERGDGTQSFLLLVDAADAQFHLAPQTRDRIETILAAAAGYEADADTLQIQPIAFATGLTGGFTPAELAELGGLLLLAGLIGFLLFTPRSHVTLQREPKRQPANDAAMLRAVPLGEPVASQDSSTKAQRVARDNPRETAQILRNWMNPSEDGPA
ncbi:MAG: hypothetical protein WA989_07095 [Henriciella sp.]|uniref:hypothetical protein n=1 Tax=Henriciella sp. TaxID=1968823 RepID=UPI003C743D55